MRTLIFFLLALNIASLKSQNIEITSNNVIINGVQFDSESRIEDYIKILGKPSEIHELINTIYVFDSLGIYIYENPRKNNEILEISFDFKKNKEFDFSPKCSFKGKILLKNYDLSISKRTSFRSIEKKCKSNFNQTLQLEFGDSEFRYNNLLLLFEHDFFLRKTKNFTIDFKPYVLQSPK